MLPKQHRLTRPDQFRDVMKAGRRRVGATVMTHVRTTDDDAPARFGFIVSKAVGGAVTRNLVKRRLRAVAASGLLGGYRGADVVVRAMPGAAEADYAQLQADLLCQLGLVSRPASSQAVTA